MKLNEFIRQKMEEKNLMTKDFLNAGISGQTWYNIMHNKAKFLMPVTMDKLALVMSCSKGDIQACMAEAPNPLREEAEKPEGTAGISITAGAGKNKKKTVPAPDPKEEEPAAVFQPEPEVDMMFPVEETAEPKETLAEFKARLTQMVFREMLVTESSLTSIVLQNIGKKLVEELIGGNKE